MSSFMLDHRTIPANHPAGTAVHLRGDGTAWTDATIFTLTGVSPAATLLQTIVNGPEAVTLAIGTGGVGGPQTLTISDGTSSATLVVSPFRRPTWFPRRGRRRTRSSGA